MVDKTKVGEISHITEEAHLFEGRSKAVPLWFDPAGDRRRAMKRRLRERQLMKLEADKPKKRGRRV